MTQRLTLSTAALLTVPPLMWAGNAVMGRMVSPLVPPMTLNLLRWVLAGLILLPLAGWVLRRDSGLWRHLGRYSLLGLLGVGCYNALQYLALHTSTPLNVTLVGAGIPMFTLAVGALCFGQPASRHQVLGALLSLTGVLLVLTRGDLGSLADIRFVPGDLYMLLANLGWALYTWLLARTTEPAAIRGDWAAFLLAQIVPGLGWSALLTAGEWAIAPQSITWGWPLAAALAFVAIGPAVLAYRCWGLGVQRVGPNVAGLFINLMPLFAAVLSATLLRETPHGYHAVAFILIAAGIVWSSRRG